MEEHIFITRHPKLKRNVRIFITVGAVIQIKIYF